ncbi:MAG: tRNA (adenosine(37)-N6)-threonylcarbamoyltransferase complex ATPase subunit type 1 TsaE [Microbacteriaceae bacterium]|nr:tRNA (adenosine(37)-N6)-threonylcarbamoyltransferase complex ATPase subunit type 1 TsaE [Microbacteriaceae bacterium]
MSDQRPQISIDSLERMHEFGTKIAASLRGGDVLVLVGDLGAGKTTLTKSIAAGLGITDAVSSPTFVISRQYRRDSSEARSSFGLIHVDAYRLASAYELEDLDLDFEQNATVIEWGRGKIDPEWAPGRYFEIEIEADPETEIRTLTFNEEAANVFGH